MPTKFHGTAVTKLEALEIGASFMHAQDCCIRWNINGVILFAAGNKTLHNFRRCWCAWFTAP